jgi:hypothetical protein
MTLDILFALRQTEGQSLNLMPTVCHECVAR